MSIECFKTIEEMLKHVRKNCMTRSDLVHFVCKQISNRSEEYDYYFENNTLKRIGKDGKVEAVLKSKRNFVIIGYLFELEKFIELNLEKKYINLETFYKKYGIGIIVKTNNQNKFYLGTKL